MQVSDRTLIFGTVAAMTSPTDSPTDLFGQLRPHILKYADVELLTPFLLKQGAINETQCKNLKQRAKLSDEDAIERLLGCLLELGSESIAQFVEALKKSVDEDQQASRYGHRKLLDIIEASSISRESSTPGELEVSFPHELIILRAWNRSLWSSRGIPLLNYKAA